MTAFLQYKKSYFSEKSLKFEILDFLLLLMTYLDLRFFWMSKGEAWDTGF